MQDRWERILNSTERETSAHMAAYQSGRDHAMNAPARDQMTAAGVPTQPAPVQQAASQQARSQQARSQQAPPQQARSQQAPSQQSGPGDPGQGWPE